MVPKEYVYAALPERCYCHTPDCGFILEKPSKHCRDLKCPKCGARLWRVPPSHSSADPYKIYESLIKPKKKAEKTEKKA